MHSAAPGRHAISVEGVGDRLETQTVLAHRRDALAQLWRLCRESGSPAWVASRLGLALPPFDLAEHYGDLLTSGGTRIEVNVERHEVCALSLEPVEQRDELAQRAREFSQASRHER